MNADEAVNEKNACTQYRLNECINPKIIYQARQDTLQFQRKVDRLLGQTSKKRDGIDHKADRYEK